MTDWKSIAPAQLGAFAEPIIIAKLAESGYRASRTSAKGPKIELLIDLEDGRQVLARVKSLRGPNYVFVLRSSFTLDDDHAMALMVFPMDYGQPELFIIPAAAWRDPDELFVAPDYPGLKSAPEYGIRLSSRWREQLAMWRVRPGAPLPLSYRASPGRVLQRGDTASPPDTITCHRPTPTA
ncbi:hypothetical protein [Microbispora bryophytorum]|uniref:DUF4365 domain-containing protein n=1 Tax=Microbispora bryophytorum subsp. camponoti TaxID=1677852 RepID=A0ABR8KUM6_9ACTN|nr:hypothetical protein [Microbispora camponoti]MBD3142445.1 hypothetical protein [Microbispora camponoti]